jgi:hypothetical protein
MKAVRISLLTLVLLAGATSRSVPTADHTVTNQTIVREGAGPCYFINGQWVCP